MAAHGCVQGHTAFIYDRGGITRIHEIKNMASIRWTRVRDDISEADITILGGYCEQQRAILQNIEPKRHELVIFRGNRRVWEGPVWRTGDEPNRFTLNAHDIGEYVKWTPLSVAWDNRTVLATEITTRLETILNYELTTPYTIPKEDPTPDVIVPPWESLTPPANILPFLTVHHFPNEARTADYTMPFEMTVGEHMDAFASNSGIDYTVVGRALHIWDTSRHIGQTRLVTDADFMAGAIVTSYGSDHTVYAAVTSDEGQTGFATSDDSYYGPWMKIFSVYDHEETEAPSLAELNSQAQRNVTGRNPVPREVRIPDNTSIRLDDTLTIDDLVPGVRIPLLATLNARRISQDQKLDKVTVTEDGDKENVAVVLTPATKPDSDIEEEG